MKARGREAISPTLRVSGAGAVDYRSLRELNNPELEEEEECGEHEQLREAKAKVPYHKRRKKVSPRSSCLLEAINIYQV